MATLVLVIDAADRPGIVTRVSSAFTDLGGTRVAAELARFGGRVAGLVLVEVPDAQEAPLRAAMAGLGDGTDLRVEVHSAGRAPDLADLVHVEINGPDRPGILGDVVKRVEDLGVSVDSLRNVAYDLPGGSGPFFGADMVLEVPGGVTIDAIRESMTQVAEDITLDVISEE